MSADGTACDRDETLAAIRDILTEWNFGPMEDRDAILSIYALLGDNIQNESQPNNS